MHGVSPARSRCLKRGHDSRPESDPTGPPTLTRSTAGDDVTCKESANVRVFPCLFGTIPGYSPTGAGRHRRALWLGAACVLGAGVALGVVLSLTGSRTYQAAQEPRQAQQPVVQPSTTPQAAGAARLAAADRWLRAALGAKPATGPKTTPSVAAARVGKITSIVVQTLPRNVRVTLDGAGYTVAHGTSKVRVASTGIAGAGAWSTYANGMTRTTATRAETVVVRGERTELYTRVDTRQGVRTWTWRIESDLTPQLQANGDILWRRSTALVTHAPRIAKLDGSDITPAGSR